MFKKGNWIGHFIGFMAENDVLACLLESGLKIIFNYYVQFTILLDGVLKNVANIAEKQLCWTLFLMKLQAFRTSNLLEGDSNTVAF